MKLSFRKISSPQSFSKLKKLLVSDVLANGGSAGEIVDMHGQLVELTVCAVPWGTITIHKPVSKLEALAWWLADVE